MSVNHPNRERQSFSIPHYPADLPGSFWGMTTFYNPCRYQRRVENYKKFRASSAKQGLKLLCVELAFGNSGYELSPDDAEIIVRLRTKDVLWQKERLLNIGLTHLPDDCDKIAWLDADILFHNDRWIEETSRLLNTYVAVQPFLSLIWLPKDIYDMNSQPWPRGHGEGCKYNSLAYEIFRSDGKTLSNSGIWGTPGFVWAIRRSVIDRCGFYDKLILGAGDAVMAYALYGHSWPKTKSLWTEGMLSDVRDWIKKIYAEVQGSVIYSRDMIAHLWHGDCRNRIYEIRGEFLKESGFDPGVDIKLDQNGCWQWATFKPLLRLYTQLYFYLRNEDGTMRGAFLANVFFFFIQLMRVPKKCIDYLRDLKSPPNRKIERKGS